MKDWIKKRIEAYRSGTDKRPIIIDVSRIEELNDINQQYIMVNKQNVFDLANDKSELPNKEDIYQFFDNCNEDLCFVYGLGTYLRLMGKGTLKELIHSLLGKAYNTKFIIVTFQCENFFDEKIPKYKDKIVISHDNNVPSSSSLVFVPRDNMGQLNAEDGLKNALKRIENTSGEKIYVFTNFHKSDFLDTLISIEECCTPYDLLCLKDKKARKLNRKFGNDVEWMKLFTKLKDNSIEATICEILSIKDVLFGIKEWGNKSPFEQWLLFIYLKITGKRVENWAIDYAKDKSQSVADFIKNIYYSILSIDYKENGYWDKYKIWKQIIKDIRDEIVIYQYCEFVKYKEEDALYYLTDNTEIETKLIIQIIDLYKSKFINEKSKLLNVLEIIYKDLYDYLMDYNYGDNFLTEYFNEYKFLKVLNVLTPEFKKKVDDEALCRSYNSRLVYRREKINEIKHENSVVYFIDALGVEFLSFIEQKCRDEGLTCNINICKANLPTLTEKNTEFRDYYKKRGVDVIDVKELDSLIHDGKNDYDFDKNKLPIHIVEEFNILNRCLDDIKKKIKSQKIKKAIIISDHGSTRLAILNKDMVKEDVESAGEHGGRVCKIVPGMKRIPNAVCEDDYYILADYNAFKGGRVGKVEMHGGATLEEVVVPIVEIYDNVTSAEIKVLDNVIKVSFKTKGILHFFCSKKLLHCIVKISGKNYVAKADGENKYSVELDDIKKAGTYQFEVWDDDNHISSNNSFIIEKESAKTNDLWG